MSFRVLTHPPKFSTAYTVYTSKLFLTEVWDPQNSYKMNRLHGVYGRSITTRLGHPAIKTSVKNTHALTIDYFLSGTQIFCKIVPRSFQPFMAKRLPTAASLEIYARVAAERIRIKNKNNPNPNQSYRSKSVISPPLSSSSSSSQAAVAPAELSGMEARYSRGERTPLSEAVSDCVKRWFLDTLKEARAGDVAMQVLVAQMYQSGYGVPKNEQKAKIWIEKASKHRNGVWRVQDKWPGYNASDSDSE